MESCCVYWRTLTESETQTSFLLQTILKGVSDSRRARLKSRTNKRAESDAVRVLDWGQITGILGWDLKTRLSFLVLN